MTSPTISQQTGRSGEGRLRNFKAMSDKKLASVSADVEAEENDPEAWAAISAEWERRIMADEALAAGEIE